MEECELGMEEDSHIFNNINFLKHKLANVLSLEQFCGICLESDINYNIDDMINVNVNGWRQNISLKNIIDSVFTCSGDVLASCYICNNCTDKLVQSYMFINNTKVTTKLIHDYINDLTSKSIDITDHLDKSFKLDGSNIVVILQTTEIGKSLPRKTIEKDMEIKDLNKEEKNLIRHTQITKKMVNGYKCLHCKVILPSYQSCWKHITQYHKKKKVLQCKICFKTFKTRQYLTAHYKVHLKVKSKIRHKIVPIGEMKHHMKEKHEDSMHLCKICNIAYSSSDSLKTHEKLCHSTEDVQKEKQCVMCLKNFKEDEFKFHNCKFSCPECSETPCIHYKYLMFYREQILNHACKAKCLDCDYVYRRKEFLLAHVNRLHLNHHPYTCDKCGQQFYSKFTLKTHIHRFHQENNCDRCPASFNTPQELKKHEKRRHDIHQCELCNKKFFKESKRQEHMDKVHGDLQIKNSRLTIVPCVVCETCGKSFKNAALLRYHQKKHSTEVPCPECNKLMNPVQLRRHLESHVPEYDIKGYRKQAKFKCKSCDYKTWNNMLLECHRNRHHLKIKPYVCHICSKDFIGKHLLTQHIKTHTLESVVCTICNKSFANSACLKMHVRLHTGEKNYACDVCGERFRSSSMMNEHKLKKHSDRRYACPLCSSKFHTVRDLRLHVVKVHWKQKNKRFNPRELEGLSEEHYHLFQDGRRVKVSEEVEFYMPCKNFVRE